MPGIDVSKGLRTGQKPGIRAKKQHSLKIRAIFDGKIIAENTCP